jgi:hypothetical protein
VFLYPDFFNRATGLETGLFLIVSKLLENNNLAQHFFLFFGKKISKPIKKG